ncbi:DUF4221 family protein [Algoriphagus sp.]|uniref:DUF4221 family protein n=1 Tax=Algoriphagus sp. TaxID=1872435 RepID=UPI003F7268B5
MKNLIPYLSLILLASCGEKSSSEKAESDNILDNLTYAVDTVVVDAGDELINLSMGLYYSDVSPDSKKLYQFSRNDHTLTIVDLDRLKIAKKIIFEKEGPNGIGASVSDFMALPEDKFMFSTFESAAIFDAQAVKLEEIKLKPDDFPEFDGEDYDLNFQLGISSNEQFLYALPGNFSATERDLALLDQSSNTAKMIDIPELDDTGKFTIILFSNGMGEVHLEKYFMEEYHEKLYLSSSVTSDLYRYDFQKDSLDFFSFPITVSPKKKTEYPKTEVSSKKEQQEESRKVQSQIAFKNLMWDESRKLFFRIGSITKSDSPDMPAKTSVFLYAFDSDMKLVGETLINDLQHIPEYPFFKDGKLYSYVNVEDELGFSVFTFDV